MTTGETADREEENIRKARAMVAFTQGAFEILTPEAYESLREFLDITSLFKSTGAVILQYYFDSDPARLADPEWISWVALSYDYYRNEDETTVQYTMLTIKQPGLIDLRDNPRYADVPAHVIQWPEDIDHLQLSMWESPYSQSQ